MTPVCKMCLKTLRSWQHSEEAIWHCCLSLRLYIRNRECATHEHINAPDEDLRATYVCRHNKCMPRRCRHRKICNRVVGWDRAQNRGSVAYDHRTSAAPTVDVIGFPIWRQGQDEATASGFRFTERRCWQGERERPPRRLRRQE